MQPQQGTPGTAWKRYIVYVQEDGATATMPAPPGHPHRKTSLAGSPESSHAEPSLDHNIPPPEYFVKAGMAGGGNTFFVQSADGSISVKGAGYNPVPPGLPGSSYAASATGTHSSHSSPRPQRHRSVHHSPQMASGGGGGIGVGIGGIGVGGVASGVGGYDAPLMAGGGLPPSPGLSRASTTYSAASSRRTVQPPLHDMYSGHAPPPHAPAFVPPQFARGATWH